MRESVMTLTCQRKILRTIFAGSAFSVAGAARLCRRSLHLGVSRGRPGRPPSLLRQSSAFRTGKAAARPVFLLAYGRSTCAELASRVGTEDSPEP